MIRINPAATARSGRDGRVAAVGAVRRAPETADVVNVRVSVCRRVAALGPPAPPFDRGPDRVGAPVHARLDEVILDLLLVRDNRSATHRLVVSGYYHGALGKLIEALSSQTLTFPVGGPPSGACGCVIL